MNDESKTNDNDLSAAEGKSNLIGVDPLAWLSEEEKESVLNESTEKEMSANNEVEEDDPCVIKLNSAITIRDITELMDELNNINTDATELIFESEQVEKIDTAALQLLSGFYLFSIKSGKKITWNKPSEAFCHAAKLLGLKDIINLPSAA